MAEFALMPGPSPEPTRTGVSRFVVVLRGVNVGKGNRVPMAGFKQMLEELGYTSVKTLLNSGNAVFSGAGRSGSKHVQAIAAELERRFGVATPVIVKSATELSAIIGNNPMVPAEDQHSRFLVAFATDQPALQSLQPLASLASGPERFMVTDEAAYLSCPAGLLESKVGAAILGKAGRAVTTRNWATVLKLEALLEARHEEQS
jgi:uncharacterized protein (DUF1697 family)